MRVLMYLVVLLMWTVVAAGQDSERRAYNKAGFAAIRESNHDEAERLFLSALKEADAAEKRDVTYSNSLLGLGRVFQAKAQYAEAERLFTQSLLLFEQLKGTDSDSVAIALIDLLNLYFIQRRYAESERVSERYFQITVKKLGPEHPEVAKALCSLAAARHCQCKYSDAEPLYKEALRLFEKFNGAESKEVASALDCIAMLYRARDKDAEAEPILKRSLQIKEKTLGLDHPELVVTLGQIIGIQMARESFVDAEVTSRHVIEILEKKFPAEYPDLVIAKRRLAHTLACQGKTDEAAPLFTTANDSLRKQPRTGDSKVAVSITSQANDFYESRRYREALNQYSVAANAFEQTLGPDDINVATSQESCAKALRKLGREKEAAVFEAEAATIRARATK